MPQNKGMKQTKPAQATELRSLSPVFDGRRDVQGGGIDQQGEVFLGLADRNVVLAACFSFITACTSGPATKPLTLSSGRAIRVISMGQMAFAQGGPALVLQYQTDLRVSDLAALEKEVAEVWADLQVEADRQKVPSAIIMANEVPKGVVIQTGHSHNFVFTREANGQWVRAHR